MKYKNVEMIKIELYQIVENHITFWLVSELSKSNLYHIKVTVFRHALDEG